METRERLLAAARAVFARRGFAGASVDEIAQEAGLTSGALYSNFEGKADLFLVLVAHELDVQRAVLEAAIDRRATLAERAQDGGEAWMAYVQREPEIQLLFAEFWAYAIRDPAVRPRIAERFAEVHAMLATLIAHATEDLDGELSVPVEQLAIVIDALADGIARQKLADPDAVPDDLLGRAIGLLVAGALAAPRA